MKIKLKVRWLVIIGLWVAFFGFVKAYGDEGPWSVIKSTEPFFEKQEFVLSYKGKGVLWMSGYDKYKNNLQVYADDLAFALNRAHAERMEQQEIIRDTETYDNLPIENAPLFRGRRNLNDHQEIKANIPSGPPAPPCDRFGNNGCTDDENKKGNKE